MKKRDGKRDMTDGPGGIRRAKDNCEDSGGLNE